MIMSKLIVKWLEWIIEIGIWLFLIAAFIGGLQVGNGFFGSLVSGVISVVLVRVSAVCSFRGSCSPSFRGVFVVPWFVFVCSWFRVSSCRGCVFVFVFVFGVRSCFVSS